MRESRTYGSVRGARGNSRPYREPQLTYFLLHLLTSGYGTTRTRVDAGTCPLPVEADIRGVGSHSG